ncbi:5-oxoprolinase subunit PxpA [Saprospiraceae bacterium]|jgi:UPF0271 protein|nr:5-oxoprolinase subunit PxpA [Bacteroidota bacterium]MDB4728643.1 5-oxoprolinase subunit PxpA [Saprospiraceae bacterium]MDF1867601.1 5-oxoprolinase subunit PxpA [Saprospiraceae bacterium]
MKTLQIDINCDMGESFGNYKIGNDEEIMPYISSANIACGFHGGDPFHIEQTIKNALKYGISIGAHPSYPDLQGFGRRKMTIKNAELKAILKYQIAAVKGLVESYGGTLKYVKPHGALYNTAANDANETYVILEAIDEIDPKILLMGMAGSITEEVAKKENIPYVAEAFADRSYTENGRLMSRQKNGSVLYKPNEIVEQVLSIILEKKVKTQTGKLINLTAQSICIHGDNPNVIEILKGINDALNLKNILKKSFA